MQTEDTLPWYRQFWPWFIIALPAAAVVAGLYTVWLSMQTGDSLVIKSDDGLQAATERNLTAAREANRIGLHASIAMDLDSGAVSVTMTSRNTIDVDGPLTLQFLHPTIAALDATAKLQKAIPDDDGNPVWAGHFVDVPRGRYYVVLSSALSSDNNWRLSGEWNGEPLLNLGASADGRR